MDGIRARDQNKESLGSLHPTLLQVLTIPLLSKSGRWGLIRCRGKRTSLSVLFQAHSEAFYVHGVVGWDQEVTWDYYLHFTEKENKIQKG